MPGYQIFSGMVFEIFHNALDRRSVDVYVDGRHEYGYLPPSFIEVFIFCRFFYDYYLTICRRKNEFVLIGKLYVRIPEELKDKNIKDDADKQHKIQCCFLFRDDLG